ncbi:MAG TPA: PilZ domain-containing protein [Croceibacterium sp.]|nr:PilZ domain-containing protein [Croceibacterium sp.]
MISSRSSTDIALNTEAAPPLADGGSDDAPAVAFGDNGDQRNAPRFTLLIRSAKLVSPVSEFLCVVRDASETGISVRLFHPLPADVPLTLEMPNGDQHPLERVWEEEGKAGFRFTEEVDIGRIVESPSEFARRAVRVRLQVPCDLVVDGRTVSATIVNLSQQGAQIYTTERLSLIQRVRIIADGMPEVAGKVRWRSGDNYGLSFEDTFQFAELAGLAFDLQRDADRKPAKR